MANKQEENVNLKQEEQSVALGKDPETQKQDGMAKKTRATRKSGAKTADSKVNSKQTTGDLLTDGAEEKKKSTGRSSAGKRKASTGVSSSKKKNASPKAASTTKVDKVEVSLTQETQVPELALVDNSAALDILLPVETAQEVVAVPAELPTLNETKVQDSCEEDASVAQEETQDLAAEQRSNISFLPKLCEEELALQAKHETDKPIEPVATEMAPQEILALSADISEMPMTNLEGEALEIDPLHMMTEVKAQEETVQAAEEPAIAVQPVAVSNTASTGAASSSKKSFLARLRGLFLAEKTEPETVPAMAFLPMQSDNGVEKEKAVKPDDAKGEQDSDATAHEEVIKEPEQVQLIEATDTVDINVAAEADKNVAGQSTVEETETSEIPPETLEVEEALQTSDAIDTQEMPDLPEASKVSDEPEAVQATAEERDVLEVSEETPASEEDTELAEDQMLETDDAAGNSELELAESETTEVEAAESEIAKTVVGDSSNDKAEDAKPEIAADAPAQATTKKGFFSAIGQAFRSAYQSQETVKPDTVEGQQQPAVWKDVENEGQAEESTVTTPLENETLQEAKKEVLEESAKVPVEAPKQRVTSDVSQDAVNVIETAEEVGTDEVADVLDAVEVAKVAEAAEAAETAEAAEVAEVAETAEVAEAAEVAETAEVAEAAEAADAAEVAEATEAVQAADAAEATVGAVVAKTAQETAQERRKRKKDKKKARRAVAQLEREAKSQQTEAAVLGADTVQEIFSENSFAQAPEDGAVQNGTSTDPIALAQAIQESLQQTENDEKNQVEADAKPAYENNGEIEKVQDTVIESHWDNPPIHDEFADEAQALDSRLHGESGGKLAEAAVQRHPITAFKVLLSFTAVVTFLMTLFVVLLFLMSDNTLLKPKSEVDLPNFYGKKATEINGNEAYAGFTIEFEDVYTNEEEKGTIVDQRPKAPRKVKENAKIVLRVSAGIQAVEVPDVVGLDRDEAKQMVRDCGLNVLFKPTQDENARIDDVVQIEPKAGTVLNAGETITLYISRGEQKATSAKVPNCIGMGSTTQVAELLTSRGLSMGAVRKVASSQPAGTVIDQSPAAGGTQPGGTAVTITVSAGPQSGGGGGGGGATEQGGVAADGHQHTFTVQAVPATDGGLGFTIHTCTICGFYTLGNIG